MILINVLAGSRPNVSVHQHNHNVVANVDLHLMCWAQFFVTFFVNSCTRAPCHTSGRMDGYLKRWILCWWRWLVNIFTTEENKWRVLTLIIDPVFILSFKSQKTFKLEWLECHWPGHYLLFTSASAAFDGRKWRGGPGPKCFCFPFRGSLPLCLTLVRLWSTFCGHPFPFHFPSRQYPAGTSSRPNTAIVVACPFVLAANCCRSCFFIFSCLHFAFFRAFSYQFFLPSRPFIFGGVSECRL